MCVCAVTYPSTWTVPVEEAVLDGDELGSLFNLLHDVMERLGTDC